MTAVQVPAQVTAVNYLFTLASKEMQSKTVQNDN